MPHLKKAIDLLERTMAEEFSQVNLIWSQKSVGHLYQRPSEHHGNNTWNISDDGFLAVYLEVSMLIYVVHRRCHILL